jgi:hypothetical protein
MADFEFPLQIKRQYADPLDFHSVLTAAARTTWLTDARRYAGQIVYDSTDTRLYVLSSTRGHWAKIPTSVRTYNDSYTADEFISRTLSGTNVHVTGVLYAAGISTGTGGSSTGGDLTIGGNLAVQGTNGITLGTTNLVNLFRASNDLLKTDDSFEVGTNLFVDGNTELGDATSDTVVVRGGPITLEAATEESRSLRFGAAGTGQANLYRVSNDQLKTDDSFEVGTNLFVDGNTELGDSVTDRVTLIGGPLALSAATLPDRALIFGSGSATANLYRWDSDVLRTDDSFIIGTNLTTFGTISAVNGIRTGRFSSLIFGNTETDTTSASLYRSADYTLRTDGNLSVGNNLTVVGGLTLVGSLTLPSQTANTVFASPNGTSGTPSFRSLVAADIPTLDIGTKTSGTLAINRGGTNSTAALNNERVIISRSGAIIESTITTAELQAGLSAYRTNFSYVTADQTPAVFSNTLSAMAGDRSSFTLEANSVYEFVFDFETLNINTPITVVSGNRNFDYIDTSSSFPNHFRQNILCTDFNTNVVTTPRYIITRNNTNIIFGLTGIDTGSTVTTIYAGSYVKCQKIA